MNQTHCAYFTTTQCIFIRVHVRFASLLLGWAATTSRLLGFGKKQGLKSFPTTQQLIASSELDPEATNLLITYQQLPLMCTVEHRPINGFRFFLFFFALPL